MHPLQTKPPTVNATGPSLQRLLRGRPAAHRAFVAANLAAGEWTFSRPTAAQAARLCRARPAQVSKLLGRSPRRKSDHAIDRLVKTIGADRVLAALDRITAPAA